MKTIVILLAFFIAGNLQAQKVKKTLLLKRRIGLTMYRIKEDKFIKVKLRNKTVYKGYMSIVSNDSIALDSTRIAIADIKKIAKLSVARTVAGHTIALIGIGALAGGAALIREANNTNNIFVSLVFFIAGAGSVSYGVLLIGSGETLAGVFPRRVCRYRKLVVKTRIVK